MVRSSPPAPGDTTARAGRPVEPGRGQAVVDTWRRARRSAGLPDTGSWDGPLVSLAIALLFGRQVDRELDRFRRARAATLTPEQIDLDVEIGRRSLRGGMPVEAPVVSDRVAGPGFRVDAVPAAAPVAGGRTASLGAGSGLLLAGALLCRAAGSGMRESRLPRARAAF